MKSRIVALVSCTVIALGLMSCTNKATDNTPTTGPRQPTATRDPNSGPDYKEIRAEIVRIWRGVETMPTPVTPSSDEERNKSYSQQFDKLINQLKGQKIGGWEGWVVQVSEQTDSGPFWVAIDMDNIADRNPFLGFEYTGIRRTGLADVVLTGVTRDDANKLSPGRKVVLSGKITNLSAEGLSKVDPADAGLAVILGDASVAELQPQTNNGSDVTITLTRPVCGMASTHCYTYELTAHGDGHVIYREDDWDTINEGTNPTILTSTVAVEKVQQLVSEFEKINYFSLQDDYDSYDVTDAPSATTSITIGTKRKSIFHYYGDTHAPNELSELEDKIEKALESAKPSGTPKP